MTNESITEDFSGKSRLISNVLTSWVSQIFLILTGFFLPRVIDQQLGQDVLGLWDFAWSIISYLTLPGLGIGSSLNKYVADYRAKSETENLTIAVSTVVFIQAILAFVIVVGTVVIANNVHWFGSDISHIFPETPMIILLLGISLAVQFLFDPSRGLITGAHRWDIYNALTSTSNILCTLTMIGAALSGYSLVSLAAIKLFFTVAEGLVRTRIAQNICPEASFRLNKISRSFAFEITKFGGSMYLFGIAPFMVLQGTNIMVMSTLGPAMLAIYARPRRLLQLGNTFLTNFSSLLIPMASVILTQEGRTELHQFTIKCARFGILFALTSAVIFCTHGGEVIRFWMGSDYVNNALIVVLGIGMMLPMAQSPVNQILIGLGEHKRISLVTVALSALIFVGGVWIIDLFSVASLEAYAMIYATSVTLTHGCIAPTYTCKIIELPISLYFKKTLVPVLKAWLVPTLLFGLLVNVMAAGIWNVLVSSMIYIFVLAFSCWFFLFAESEKKKLRKLLHLPQPFENPVDEE